MILLSHCSFIYISLVLYYQGNLCGKDIVFLFFSFPKAPCYLIPTSGHHFCLWHHDQLLWNTWSRDLVDLRCLWRLPLRKVLRAWIHVHLLDLRGRGSRKSMRDRRYQRCMFICCDWVWQQGSLQTGGWGGWRLLSVHKTTHSPESPTASLHHHRTWQTFFSQDCIVLARIFIPWREEQEARDQNSYPTKIREEDTQWLDQIEMHTVELGLALPPQ